MNAAIIRPCSVDEIENAPRLPELLAAYRDESHIPEIGEPEPCFTTYRAMEACGALRVIGAFAPDLVGAAFVLVSALPHYAGRKVGTLESFFVLPESRQGGAGNKLLRAAEDMARSMGAVALLVSAPVGGRLDSVMQHSIYRPTNRIFTRAL